MSQLVKDLRIKAGMLIMGERIAFGSDAGIMDAAAAEIERLQTIEHAARQLVEFRGHQNEDMAFAVLEETLKWPVSMLATQLYVRHLGQG